MSDRPRKHVINLYVKAGSDKECIGCCPFSQRLFMILWLKGAIFNVTTVSPETKPHVIKNLAPGTNPPFIVFDDELLTDICKCEDYVEAELYPPHYPKLLCKYHESNTVGNDIFAKFSAFIKYTGDRRSDQGKALEAKLVAALRKFDNYMKKPLDHEIDPDTDEKEELSRRKFIDGDHMTLADCTMLPKLNILRVAGKQLAGFEIPQEFTGIHRYLAVADNTDEFTQTRPTDDEICNTYRKLYRKH